jgi:2'-hydroxyisoflavone reductase
MLDTLRDVAESDAEFVWVDSDFLAAQDVGEWMELPLWIREEGFSRLLEADPTAALAHGLKIRPLAETARDTLEWWRGGEAPIEPPAGLAREKEQQVLDAWASKE